MPYRVIRRTFSAAAVAAALAMGLAWSTSIASQPRPATSSARAAPSFDCTKVTQEAEKLVCASPELAALDEELKGAYEAALAHVESDSMAALKKEQRNWVRYVRNVCDDSACLKDAYASRIAMLKRNERIVYNEGSSCSNFGARECNGIVFYRDPTAEISSFNKSISENAKQGRIITCHRLIDLPVGYARSNHSFGAYCTLQIGSTREEVAICNDLMWGHFAMEPVGKEEPSDAKLVHFTDSHCFGG